MIIDRELGGAAAWGLIMTVGALGALMGGAVGPPLETGKTAAPWDLRLIAGRGNARPLADPARCPCSPSRTTAMLTLVAISSANTLWETDLQQRIPQASLSRVNSSYDWMVSLVVPAGRVRDHRAAWPTAIGEDQTLLLASAIAAGPISWRSCVPGIRNMRRLDTDASTENPDDVGPATA